MIFPGCRFFSGWCSFLAQGACGLSKGFRPQTFWNGKRVLLFPTYPFLARPIFFFQKCP
ncbi:hypothetical protein MtrunA17_Chr1g0158671 [Medicago truncatula]|uniref:Uncharacterized protein n=1 Tax=Medicago truncatula TaxID=3880 RepID=A0A396JKC4_MEDTR|nr:hypothetical protein MtrunA17_Chr1g0158671 [Medicago truncatula]